MPLEQADTNPATAQYLEVIGGQGIRTSSLSQGATSAFLLWATVATECGSNLTRDCMVEGLKKVTSWTAGRMQAATNPGQNLPGDCSMTLNLDGTSWIQWNPSEQGQFDCDPGNFITVDTPAVAEAQLGPDRISRKYSQ